MCNRVATPEHDELFSYFDKQAPSNRTIFKIDPYPQFYNADSFTRPYLPFTASDEPDRVQLARWKLLPRSVKNETEAVQYANTFNARSEEIFTKYSYRDAIKVNRGLLWVSGFFEPFHPRPKVTIPFFIRAKNREPFTLGCVFTNWVDQETGEAMKTFSIITTPPNELVSRIHNEGQRMPLVIPEDRRAAWLGPLNEAGIVAMMQPLPDGYLEGYPVSNMLYKRGVDNNTPEMQVPAEYPGLVW
ncbi:MAG: SOS response-associated peptidase [Taibaiella sp.]|nr:SOS response-associated peptidase [Taibaiella sp.]